MLRSNHEWSLLCESHLNVMIEGEESRVEETIVALAPHLIPTVMEWSGGSIDLSSVREGSVVLRNVDRMDGADQHRVLAWMRDTDPRAVQVASTSSANLYRHVCEGRFLRDLYYYLNTVRLELW